MFPIAATHSPSRPVQHHRDPLSSPVDLPAIERRALSHSMDRAFGCSSGIARIRRLQPARVRRAPLVPAAGCRGHRADDAAGDRPLRWARGGERPTRVMLAASWRPCRRGARRHQGDFTTLEGGLGSLLTLVAVACWVTYTMEARVPADVAAALHRADGRPGHHHHRRRDRRGRRRRLAAVSQRGDVAAAWWEIAFLVSFGAVIAVLAWNVGAQKARIGQHCTVHRPGSGCGLRYPDRRRLPTGAGRARGCRAVIGALVYANLAGRQPAPSRHAVEHMFDSSR